MSLLGVPFLFINFFYQAAIKLFGSSQLHFANKRREDSNSF